jgi:hypothetical protein
MIGAIVPGYLKPFKRQVFGISPFEKEFGGARPGT